MSHANTYRPRRRRAAFSTWVFIGMLAILAAAAAAVGTFALWNEQSAWPQAQFVTSGNLQVTATGDPVWRETSPDVGTAPQVVDPEEFLIRAGDTVSADFPFQVELGGNNMQAKLNVNWATDIRIPDSVIGRYTVINGHGEPLSSSATELGGETMVELAEGDDTTATYMVRLYLDFAGLDDRFGADSVDQLDDLGDLTIELHQARPGEETP